MRSNRVLRGLKSLSASFRASGKPRTPASRRTASRRLTVEPLEDRLLLTVQPSWVFGVGGASSIGVYPLANATSEPTGDVVVTGVLYGTVDFDPGPGTFNLTSAGDADIFVAKYTGSGGFRWAKGIGGTGRDWGSGIDVDRDGNVYVTGGFAGTVDFGGQQLTSMESSAVFITKLDSAGNFLWTTTAGNDAASDIVVDENGSTSDWSVYVVGTFHDTAQFGSDQLTSKASKWDGFVSRVNAENGQFLWTRSIGGKRSSAPGVDLDDEGNVYVVGNFYGRIKLGDTALKAHGGDGISGIGPSDGFVTKIDALGNFLWATALDGDHWDPRDIAVDGNNAYLTGAFSGTADFGAQILTSAGGSDIIVVNLETTQGDFVWVHRMGSTSSDDRGTDITADMNGNLYVTGWFSGEADFGGQTLIGAGRDAFVSQLDTAGNFIQSWGMGQEGYGITVDAAGNVYAIGVFHGSADFPTGDILTAVGGRDMYLLKFSTTQFAHDIAVSMVDVTPLVVQGDEVPVSLRVENQGTSSETFDVTLTDDTDGVTIGTQSVTLAASESTILDFTWFTMTASVGEHTLIGTATLATDEDPTDNSLSTMTSVEPERHDVAVTSVIAADSAVQGSNVTVEVTVENQGNRPATFNVQLGSDNTTPLVGADDIIIQTWPGVSLDAGAATVLSTVWSTTAANIGAHILTASASTVVGEVETADNLRSTTVAVTEPGGVPKFFVVDADSDQTFSYDSLGGALVSTDLAAGNTELRGATASPDGTIIWVIDSSNVVYVYDNSGSPLGSWTAEGVNQAEGIATDGNDLWILDGKVSSWLWNGLVARLHRFNGGASIRSGTHTGNSYGDIHIHNARGITTNGTDMWIVEDGPKQNTVYKFGPGGQVSWTIDSANSKPKGITIDPSGGSDDLWIVDSGQDRVFRYADGALTTSGSHPADSSFPLAAGNTNPQGIADPPAASTSSISGSGSTRNLTGSSSRATGTPTIVVSAALRPDAGRLDSEIDEEHDDPEPTNAASQAEPKIQPDQSSDPEAVDAVLVDLNFSTLGQEEDDEDTLMALLEPDLHTELLSDVATAV